MGLATLTAFVIGCSYGVSSFFCYFIKKSFVFVKKTFGKVVWKKNS